jgi:hypothetical protein
MWLGLGLLDRLALHWEAGKATARVIIIVIVVIAEEGRKEDLRNCFLDIGEFATNFLPDSLLKLPFLE